MAIIATYFDFNTGSAKIETAAAADKICDAVFRMENLIGIGFSNQYGTPIPCRPKKPRPANLTYFDFCSVGRALALGIRGPDTDFSFDFVLKLPQNFVKLVVHVISNITSPCLNLS